MKIAIISDTHSGIRNSSEIFMDYQERFYRDVFFPYLIENGIKKIVHLGDYYENRVSINFKALAHNRRIFLDRLRELGIHMDIIPGNHDVYYKNTNDLCALNELQGHYMNEVRIIEKPTVMKYDGLKMALIPWINSENEARSLEFISTCKADIVGAHLELQGFEMQAGIMAPEGMSADIFSRFETVLSGHYHTKSQQGNVHYLGTQMEFMWSDAHDKKYFHVLDTETRELEAIQNPLTIYEKIYYDDKKTSQQLINVSHLDYKFVKIIVVNKTSPLEFEKFVERVNAKKIHGLQISETFTEFTGSSVDDADISVEDTETLLNSYIDAVDTDLDKDRIKSQIRNLMIEAQLMEVA